MAENEPARFPEADVARVLAQLEETRREILRVYVGALAEYATIEKLAGES